MDEAKIPLGTVHSYIEMQIRLVDPLHHFVLVLLHVDSVQIRLVDPLHSFVLDPFPSTIVYSQGKTTSQRRLLDMEAKQLIAK